MNVDLRQRAERALAGDADLVAALVRLLDLALDGQAGAVRVLELTLGGGVAHALAGEDDAAAGRDDHRLDAIADRHVDVAFVVLQLLEVDLGFALAADADEGHLRPESGDDAFDGLAALEAARLDRRFEHRREIFFLLAHCLLLGTWYSGNYRPPPGIGSWASGGPLGRVRRSGYTGAMFMRLPDSGSLLGSIVNGLGHTVADGNGIAIDAVTEAQLGEALTAMASGDLEYVILEDGDAFVQAAGDGAGPYALQFSPAVGPRHGGSPRRRDRRGDARRAPRLSPRRPGLAQPVRVVGDVGWRRSASLDTHLESCP